ncbi:MAG: hypothetical protein B6243_07395 [Anaerolineaceae bacterium 4572_5.2]|nr:MAG: hypothetical protein B6243_07395 [Anaerolineaceae bacterium 4572_5.2]
MLTQTKEVYNIALTLPPVERIELIEHLHFSLASFDLKKRIDTLWAKEAEDRISAFENGELKAIPAKTVFKKIDSYKQNEG